MNEVIAQGAGPDELLRLKAEYLIPCVYHFLVLLQISCLKPGLGKPV